LDWIANQGSPVINLDKLTYAGNVRNLARLNGDSRHIFVNVITPGIMAEEAKQMNAALIHYSSDYVFDGSKKSPYNKEDKPNPLNVYGRTKLAGEQAIQAVGTPHIILRTSLSLF
jgi:dTDP-4-dehydrorhamnose reductase